MVDDVEVAPGILSEPIAVNPGKRVVSAKSSDGGEARGEIELGEREVREIELTLAPHSEAAKSPAPASTGPTPATSPDKPSTEPRVRGFANDDVEPRSAARTPVAEGLMFGGGMAAGIGLTVGFITGALTFSKAGDVRPQCDNNICAPTAKDDLDSASTLATISTVAFAVGIAGAAAFVVGVALPRRPSPQAKHAIVIGPGGIRGTFE
jgi:hypothetical protein